MYARRVNELVDRVAIHERDGRNLEHMSATELTHLKIWIVNMLHRLGKRMSLRQQAIATSVVYVKRFYLNNDYHETDLGLVMASCIYLASKVEECPLHIKTVLNETRNLLIENGIMVQFPFDHHRLAEMEFYLVEELDFKLIVSHPYRSLESICTTNQACQANGQAYLSLDEKTIQMTWFIINDLLRTDATLMYPPHLLAIAALYVSQIVEPSQKADSSHRPANSREASPSLGPALSSTLSSMPVLVLPPLPQHSRATATPGTKSQTKRSTETALSPVEWFSNLKVRHDLVFEIVQTLLETYRAWDDLDDAKVIQTLKRLRESQTGV